jgi:hypothetical protein
MSGRDSNGSDADVCTPSAPLTPDDREGQCRRAADYMEANPGCTLVELSIGADLGSASKVVSEMVRTFGYQVRRLFDREQCANGQHSRRRSHYWLEGRPVAAAQFDLFTK